MSSLPGVLPAPPAPPSMSGPAGDALQSPGRSAWWRVWRVFGLILAFYLIEANVETLVSLTVARAQLGYVLPPVDVTTTSKPDTLMVTDVPPGSPTAKAGVERGDLLIFDRPADRWRPFRTGERIGLTRLHRGVATHVELTAATSQMSLSETRHSILFVLSCLIPGLFGAFILWRSRGRPVVVLLGLALASYGLAYMAPSNIWSASISPLAFSVLNIVDGAVFAPLFLAFAMRFAELTAGKMGRWPWIGFWVYAAVDVLKECVSWGGKILGLSLPDLPGPTSLYELVGFAASMGFMFLGWRAASAGARGRYTLMLIALSGPMIAQAIYDSLGITGPLSVPAFILTGLFSPALFAYAILRHKVLDLGFALNRTVVYGVVSLILLAGFGLIEWAVDHFVPIEGRENNALVDAAIAVAVFLTFHRVRDVVEHVVEGLFFRGWQKAEAGLRRFVREAAFVSQPQALVQAFTRALADYAEGAETAVYLAAEAEIDGYARADGEVAGVPARLDWDLPPLVSLRAEPKPADLHDDALGAALIAPMVNRNEVMGFVLLSPKPSGNGYRPDEIELIGWATRQVGLDLHALKMERLEKERSELRIELRSANAQLDRMLGLSAPSA